MTADVDAAAGIYRSVSRSPGIPAPTAARRQELPVAAGSFACVPGKHSTSAVESSGSEPGATSTEQIDHTDIKVHTTAYIVCLGNKLVMYNTCQK